LSPWASRATSEPLLGERVVLPCAARGPRAPHPAARPEHDRRVPWPSSSRRGCCLPTSVPEPVHEPAMTRLTAVPVSSARKPPARRQRIGPREATEESAPGEPTFRVRAMICAMCSGESKPRTCGPDQDPRRIAGHRVACDPKRYSPAPYRSFTGLNRCASRSQVQEIHRGGSRARGLAEDRCADSRPRG
jgi:hypothetical protein